MHTGEKPYNCDLCPAHFARNTSLTTHKRRYHTNEKPYKCNLCPSRFIQTYALKRHVRIHTGEKPYQCDFCSARFAASSGLATHIKRHQCEEKFYKCELCSAQFSNSCSLRKHKRTHTETWLTFLCSCPICTATKIVVTNTITPRFHGFKSNRTPPRLHFNLFQFLY